MLDRVIQQAIAQVLTPAFESEFYPACRGLCELASRIGVRFAPGQCDHSYGFREGRSAHQAVRQLETGWNEGRCHAVDCDLKSFFDTVQHDRLMAQLREKAHDRKVLGLI